MNPVPRDRRRREWAPAFVAAASYAALMAAGLFTAALARGDEVDEQLAVLSRVGPNASGSTQARAALDAILSNGDAQLLPRLLTAMEPDNPVARNWLRAAYETLVRREKERAAAAGEPPRFPREFLCKFVEDPARAGRPRRLALALLEELDPGTSERLFLAPESLSDSEFRLEAVAAQLTRGLKLDTEGSRDDAAELYRMTLDHARDAGQVAALAQKLRGLGETVDLRAHFGFVHDWMTVGPFPSPGYSGFAASFGPERGVRLDSPVAHGDVERRWKRFTTPDEMGTVNLIEAIAPAVEAVGYAFTIIESAEEQDCELRAGADDNITVWLNDEKILAREQWLNGTRLDRFVAPAKLRAGANRLLLKVCQGPKHKDPAVPNNWTFQLRLCDATGRGVKFQCGLPPREEEQK